VCGETNGLKWLVFQLVYMTVLAYTASLLVFQALRAFGVS
jgi:Fe2+ transport system protein B